MTVPVLRIEEGRFTFTDVLRATRTASRQFTLDSMVVGGALWHTA